MYKDVAKRFLAVLMCVCLILGLTDFSVLTAKAAGGDLSSAVVNVNGASIMYDGTPKEPTSIDVTMNGTLLTEGVDYTLSWPDKINAGTKTVTITGKGSYTGTASATYKITPRPITLGTVITIAAQKMQSAGTAVVPQVGEDGIYIEYNGKMLTGMTEEAYALSPGAAVDFTYKCTDNTAPGTARIKITGRNNFANATTKPFTILSKTFSDDAVISGISDIYYDDFEDSFKPDITITTKADGTVLTEGVDYTVTYIGNTTRPGTVEVVIVGCGNYQGNEYRATYNIIKSLDEYADDITTSDIGSYPYTGKAIEIENLVVYDKGIPLEEGVHYEMSCENNTNAGPEAYVMITGKGCYEGTKNVFFTIEKAKLEDCIVDVTSKSTYTGEAIQPAPVITYNGTRMNANDYTVRYENNIDVGTATVVITGNNRNLSGSVTTYFQIEKKSIANANDATISVTVEEIDYEYNGSQKIPEVEVIYTPRTGFREILEKDVDYTLEYKNNTNAGEATITITGKGNYTGSRTQKFTINGINIASGSDVQIMGIDENTSYPYTGEAIKVDGIKVIYKGSELLINRDYTVTYQNNVYAGTATVIINGINNYTGEIIKSFAITSMQINESTAFITCPENVTYSFGAIEPAVTVQMRLGQKLVTLKKGVDYELVYSGNTKVGTATVEVVGIGGFEGRIVKSFTIAPLDLTTNASAFTWEGLESTYFYAGNNVEPKEWKLRYTDGSILPADAYDVIYSDNAVPGTGKIIVQAKDGSNFTGTLEKTFAIKGDLAFGNDTEISEVVEKVYTGGPVQLKNEDLTITYKLLDKVLVLGTDYQLVNYSNHVEPGDHTASVEIQGMGMFMTSSGQTLSKNFTIVPKDLDDVTVGDVEDEIKLSIGNIASPEYTGSPLYPELNITYNGIILKEGTHYEIVEEECDCTNASAFVEGSTSQYQADRYVTIKGKGKYFTGTRKVYFSITPRRIVNGRVDVANLNIERMFQGEAFVIDPLEITYVYTYTDGSTLELELTEDDYTCLYENNERPGQATLLITGKGNFSMTVAKRFGITGDLSDTENIAVTIADKVYTGSAVTLQEEDITVTYYGVELIYGIDYTLEYQEGTNVNASDAVPVTIVPAQGSYYIGSNAQTFKILKKSITEEDIIPQGLVAEGYTYTGEAIYPEFTLKYGNLVVEPGEDKDCVITWENNTNAVTDWENTPEENKPAIVITANEVNYTGVLRIPFKINPRKVDGDETVAKNLVQGSGATPDEIIIGEELAIRYKGEPVVFDNLVVTWDGQVLTPAETDADGNVVAANDYSISYAVDKDANDRNDNDEVGTGYLVITGNGNYAGTKEIPFRITGDLSAEYGVAIVQQPEAQPYTMPCTEPDVTITYYGQVLKEGKDYELSYANNINVGGITLGSLDKAPTIFITGKGGFEGSETKTYFEIKVRDLSDNTDGTMVLEGISPIGYFYTGEAIVPEGLVLKNNGYTVDLEQYNIEFRNNIQVGEGDLSNPKAPYLIISGKYDETTGEGGNYTGSMKVPFTIKPAVIEEGNSAFTISKVEDYIYTGSPITPMVEIMHHGRQLILGEEYEIVWENNIETALSNSAQAPTVIVRGIGNYTGEMKIRFNILKQDIGKSEADFIITVPEQAYNGEEHMPMPEVVTKDGYTLVHGVDYEVSIPMDADNVSAGTDAKIKITGIGDYTGTLTVRFTITPKSIVDDTLVITGIEDRVYNTKQQLQQPVITLGDLTLTEEDYTLTYADNVDTGVATVFISGTGNYTGTKEVTFNITPMEIATDKIVIEEMPFGVYTGEAITPIPTVSYKDESLEIDYTLVAGKDFTVSYENNNEIGKDVATAIITGMKNFSGSISTRFTIKGNVALSTISSIPVQNYTGEEIKPEPVVTQNGRTLLKGVDYELVYQNNVEAGRATITINGIGEEFGGSVTVAFDIVRDISAGITVTGLAEKYLYTGEEIVPALGRVSAYGIILDKNEDYKVTVVNNVKVGVATLIIEGMSHYKGTKTFNFNIVQRRISQCSAEKVAIKTFTGKAIKPAVTLTYNGKTLTKGKDYTLTYAKNTMPGTAKIIAKGIGNFSGRKTVTFKIQLAKVKSVKVKNVSDSKITLTWKKQKLVTGYQIYNDKNEKVAQVKGKNKRTYTVNDLKGGTSYSYKVRSYVKRGGKTYYSTFTEVVTATTKLAAPQITVSSKKAKQASITWKKVSGATGYEIYSSTKQKSGYKKIATVTGSSYTNKKLTGNKKYYYKVRAYKTIKGKKTYGSFSEVAYVTIK